MGYGVIPDLKELEVWIRSGLTPTQCSEKYETRGQHVPAGTIRVASHRAGWRKFRLDHAGLIPWSIQPQHRGLNEHVMLARESRRRQGVELSPVHERELDAWLTRLNEQDAVVQYDRSTDEGWWLLPRRVGRDLDLIWTPDLDDEWTVAGLRPDAIPLLSRGLLGAS